MYQVLLHLHHLTGERAKTDGPFSQNGTNDCKYSLSLSFSLPNTTPMHTQTPMQIFTVSTGPHAVTCVAIFKGSLLRLKKGRVEYSSPFLRVQYNLAALTVNIFGIQMG